MDANDAITRAVQRMPSAPEHARRAIERWWNNLASMLSAAEADGLVEPTMMVVELRQRINAGCCSACGIPLSLHDIPCEEK